MTLPRGGKWTIRRTLGALVSLEQDSSVSELAGGYGASRYEPLQLNSFGLVQNIGIFLLHNG